MNYFFYKNMKQKNLENGISRKVLAYNDNLMTVEVSFEEGAQGQMHNHPHEQITYVLEGEFLFKIGDSEKVVTVGDTLYKQPNILHGCICLKKGKLLDIFTPMRTDFIENN